MDSAGSFFVNCYQFAARAGRDVKDFTMLSRTMTGTGLLYEMSFKRASKELNLWLQN
jgi:hypothetical protein